MSTKNPTSVQAAHDALLAAQPDGVSHDAASCPLCTVDIREKAGEASVADEVTYTETQHTALLTAAVQRETAGLVSEKEGLESEKAEVSGQLTAVTTERDAALARVDVLEAEKASAEQARDAAVQEFEDFKTAQDAEREKADRLDGRVERIKAAAPALSEAYLGDTERRTRWAEMSEEAFDALLDSLTETAKQGPHSFKAGDGERCADCGQQKTAFLHKAAERSAEEGGAGEASRESASFNGGQSPTGDDGKKGSLTRQALSAFGKLPAGSIS
jgi:hypothetical protein